MERKEKILEILLSAGAVAAGIAKAEPVDSGWADRFDNWIEKGLNAGMDYMRNHAGIRRDPRLLLDGAKSVISVAFSYNHSRQRSGSLPSVAMYAYGDDYHDVLRRVLSEAVDTFKNLFGGNFRICIDSAPVMERYWAMKAGIGFLGMNDNIIVPGAGGRVFLAEIITDLEIPVDNPTLHLCENCGKCRRACPTGALREDGMIDCRKCLSYLTIEHRGEWSDHEAMEAVSTEAGRTTLYGCDRCVSVCPHNNGVSTDVISPLRPKDYIYSLDSDDILSMAQEDFSRQFKGSAIKRAKLTGLLRNARNCHSSESWKD